MKSNKSFKYFKNKYVDFVYKHFSFIKNIKLRLLFLPIIIVILIFFVAVLSTNIYGIMGNSAINYYCEDTTFELKDNQCVKERLVDSILTGDVNLNRKIDSGDLKTLSKYLDGSINLSSNQLIASDLDEDGRIDSNDFNTLTSLISSSSDESTIKTNSNASEYIMKTRCPKSTKKNVSYTLKKNKCLEKIVMTAKLNKEGYFFIEYDSNGGILKDTTSMTKQTVDISKTNNKLQKNKYIKYSTSGNKAVKGEPLIFKGWHAYKKSNKTSDKFDKILCYSNASHSDAEWIDIKDEKNTLLLNGTCKFGMYIFEDEEEIKNIAIPNETISMKAVWSKFFELDNLTNVFIDKNINNKEVAVKYNIGGFDAVRLRGINSLKTNSNSNVDKSIQDIHVSAISGNENIFLSQYLSDTIPHQIFITNITDNNSQIFLQNLGQCGIGMFDINNNHDIYVSCDTNAEYVQDKNSFGQKTYRYTVSKKLLSSTITPSNSKKLIKVIDGIKNHGETVKLDEKNNIALFRSFYDNKQHFVLYSFDSVNNKVGAKIKEFELTTQNKSFSGYDIDGKYLFIYSNSNKKDITASYIDVYDMSSSGIKPNMIKLVKSNTVYEYKKNDIFMEAKGISVLDNNVYISMMITSKDEPVRDRTNIIGNSKEYKYKYSLVYKIPKNRIIN